MKKIIIGADAGGTKTKVVAFDENGRIIAEEIGGAGSPAVVGSEAVSIIEKIIIKLLDKLDFEYEIMFINLGLSGFGVLGDVSKSEEEMAKKFNTEVSIDSDVYMGLNSILENKYTEGILVIGGTGSAVAGIKDDNYTLYGGFGVLLTEAGSSYASVKMLIVNIINNYEENMTYSSLAKEFMELINITTLNEFRKFMYANTKTEIASYSPFISKKALEGNEEAIAILKKSGRYLADQVRKAVKNMKLSKDAVLGFNGSFIEKAPFVKEEILIALEEMNINIQNISSNTDPVYGAYCLARKKGLI